MCIVLVPYLPAERGTRKPPGATDGSSPDETGALNPFSHTAWTRLAVKWRSGFAQRCADGRVRGERQHTRDLQRRLKEGKSKDPLHLTSEPIQEC